MSAGKLPSVVALMLVFMLIAGAAGCAAPVSDGGCSAVQAALERANAELDEARAELSQTKAALDQAKAELVEVKAASLEELLRERRSVREYADAPLTQDEVFKLLWAAQGITRPWGGRTAPSAGALYPLELYLVAGNMEGLAPGVYKYEPAEEKLTHIKDGDVRASLAVASLGQDCVREAAIDIVIAAVYERTTGKYGSRGERYVHIEVGHAAQNICLQATALGLGLVTVGAFQDDLVKTIVGMAVDETPLYIIPVGRER